MARRTVSFTVDVSVDEDIMRLREDDDTRSFGYEEGGAWTDVQATLLVALQTIALDNLDGLDADVQVRRGSTGIDYGVRSPHGDNEQVD